MHIHFEIADTIHSLSGLFGTDFIQKNWFADGLCKCSAPKNGMR